MTLRRVAKWRSSHRYGAFTSTNLLQFREDCALLPTDECFSVCAVAKGEPDLTGGVRIHDRLSVRSGRLQVAFLEEQRHG